LGDKKISKPEIITNDRILFICSPPDNIKN